MINHSISLTILAVEGDQVKIGIAAPKDVSIYRKELYEAIQLANKEAIASTIPLQQIENLLKHKPRTKSRSNPKQ